MTCSGLPLSACAAVNPPKPAPMMTTRGPPCALRWLAAMSLAGDASRARGIVVAERCADGWALLAISGLLSLRTRLPQRAKVRAPVLRETRHRLEREP